MTRLLLVVLCAPAILLGVTRSTAPAPAQVVSLSDIPSPRPNGWSVDLTGAITPSARQAIDRLGDEVSAQLGAEIAVVVVGSIGNANPRRFATNLFNRWGIGDPNRNNGILIFVALDDRAAELILGNGIDDTPQLTIADDIMQQEMVPRLRQGDPSNAVLAGATTSVNRILRPLSTSSTAAPLAPFPLESEPGDAPQEPGGSPLPLFGGVAGALAALGFGGRKLVRYRNRDCPHCGAQCMRLDEVQDDAYLSSAERTEEQIGSVDYDVWACPRCSEVQKFRYGAFFTRYSTCPRCRAKTKNKTTDTIRAATRSHEGLVEVTERCAHCSYENQYRRTTPVISSSSESSGSSGFSGGSSSGGGSSGSW